MSSNGSVEGEKVNPSHLNSFCNPEKKELVFLFETSFFWHIYQYRDAQSGELRETEHVCVCP